MAKPIQVYGGPQYMIGPQGNKIGVRGGGPVLLPPGSSPIDYPGGVPAYDPLPPVLPNPPHMPPVPVITHPHVKPKRPPRRHPLPPMRVPPSPPIMQPARPPHAHTWHHRRAHGHLRPHPAPLGPPVYMPPTETPAPVVVVAPPAPVATGPICPTWGYLVRTNPDGSETVVQCQPGQHAAAGLHGLEGIGETMAGYLGPNWMLYVGLGLAAWFFLKKR